MKVWFKFSEKEKLFKPSIKYDKNNGCIWSDGITCSGKFKKHFLEDLRKIFLISCEDLTSVEIEEKWLDEIRAVISQCGKNRILRDNEHLGILEFTEEKHTDIANIDPFLKDDFKIPCCFNDYKKDFDKDDQLKYIAWGQFLEAFDNQWNTVLRTNRDASRFKESIGEGDEIAALLGNTRASKNYSILSYEVRPLLLELEKEWFRKLKSVAIPLKSLLRNLDGLISQLEEAAAEEKVL